jgi:hypothetical protein
MAPHFSQVSMAPDWELRVAAGAQEAGGKDLILHECTGCLFSLIDTLEKRLAREEKDALKEKKAKLRKRKPGVLQATLKKRLKHAPPKAIPPTPVSLFVNQEIDRYAERDNLFNGNRLKLRHHMQRVWKNELSAERKAPYVNLCEVEKKKWGESMVLYLSQGGFINGVDLCAANGRPKTLEAPGPFSYFLHLFRALQVQNGGDSQMGSVRPHATRLWQQMSAGNKMAYENISKQHQRYVDEGWESFLHRKPNSPTAVQHVLYHNLVYPICKNAREAHLAHAVRNNPQTNAKKPVAKKMKPSSKKNKQASGAERERKKLAAGGRALIAAEERKRKKLIAAEERKRKKLIAAVEKKRKKLLVAQEREKKGLADGNMNENKKLHAEKKKAGGKKRPAPRKKGGGGKPPYTGKKKAKLPGPYTCPLCPGKSYASKATLQVHTNTIHSERRYTFFCQQCGNLRYSSQLTLDAHMKRKHGVGSTNTPKPKQTKKPKGNKASRPAALAPTPQIGGGSSSLDILLQATDIFVGQTTGPADKGANDMAE